MQTFIEGILEVKRVGGKKREQEEEEARQEKLVKRPEREAIRSNQQFGDRPKRWNPCVDSNKYELERHDHEPRHGDLWASGGLMGLFKYPEGCHETAGNPPFCADDLPARRLTNTNGERGGLCRVQNPDAPPKYRCNAGTACVMAVGTPKGQCKGKGEYRDETCDSQCVDGQEDGWKCASDVDCALAGVCSDDSRCLCNPWALDDDCSHLNFAPVERSKLGYLHKDHPSCGGSVLQRADGTHRMYASEILCKEGGRKRCGLNDWETHSQIVEATSTDIEGPYQRVETVLPPPEHHNPSVHASPADGDWHLFSISGPAGPMVRTTSPDEGKTRGVPRVVSPHQNPGPLPREDGSALLFYRADGMDLPSPTCSGEGIGVARCPPGEGACDALADLVFGRTGEDPSAFADRQGNHHMLFNALPYRCVPKLMQGGCAWSRDGVEWSAPRVGAFDTTIRFADGSSVTCERRERPQMIPDGEGRPATMTSGVTGCPRGLGDAEGDGDGRFYRGADDCFMLVQRMNT